MATTTSAAPLRATSAWQALEAHANEIRDVRLRDLFADDPARGERLTLDAEGIYLDYSKNRITDETLRLLVALAAERGVTERRDAMFAGELEQQAESLVGDAVLGVVEVQAGRFHRQALAAGGILGKELAEVRAADLLVVLLESPPGEALGQWGSGAGRRAGHDD